MNTMFGRAALAALTAGEAMQRRTLIQKTNGTNKRGVELIKDAEPQVEPRSQNQVAKNSAILFG
jgi:hypothetical protein